MRNMFRSLTMILVIAVILTTIPASAIHARPADPHPHQSLNTTPQAISLTITGQWVDSKGNNHPMRIHFPPSTQKTTVSHHTFQPKPKIPSY